MTDVAAIVVAASGSRVPRAGADLSGWSALALLGDVASADGAWLLVERAAEGWLSGRPVAMAAFVRMRAEFQRSWPFTDAALGGVVINGDALAGDVAPAMISRVLSEATRTAGPDGNVLVVCRSRLVPRRLRFWRESGRQRVDLWRRAAVELSLEATTCAGVGLDDGRVTELLPLPMSRERGADHVVLRVSVPGRSRPTVLDAIVTEAGRRLGIELRIDRIGVRKIGKTAVFVSAPDSRRFVLRITRSSIARARAARNARALELLRASSIPATLSARVPTVVASGEYAGFCYTMEDRLPGASGPSVARKGSDREWEASAVEYVTALHQCTRESRILGDDDVARLVREPFARLIAHCPSAATARGMARVADACARAFDGRRLSLVLMHGDFTVTNCLFDARGALTGVIDWEVAIERGLPLLDLLQLMPVPGESSRHSTWQRFSAWMHLYRHPDAVLSDRVMGGYVCALEIPADLIPALVVMHWVTHIAERIDARSDDARWMRVRYVEPMEAVLREWRD